jgi:hypothetical protein
MYDLIQPMNTGICTTSTDSIDRSTNKNLECALKSILNGQAVCLLLPTLPRAAVISDAEGHPIKFTT